MKKVFLFSIFLLCGLFFSQILPSALGSAYGTLASISKWLMFICLAFIMINVGREFELDKAKWRSYTTDYFIAMATAAVPWLLIACYYIFFLDTGLSWENNLLISRFAAPTSAGILFTMLAAAGFDDAVISASSDLDEYLIESLKAQDAKINSWGVGTRLITANDNPAFGGVYKLAAVKDADSTEFTPKIKLSENTEKVTNPGNKTVYRLYNKKTGKIRADLICLADEKLDADQNMVLFDPIDTWKKTKVLGGTYEVRELLVPVIREGKRVYESPSVMELREYCQKEQNTLWDESRRFVNPQKVYVDLSQKLWDLKKDLLEEISEKALD